MSKKVTLKVIYMGHVYTDTVEIADEMMSIQHRVMKSQFQRVMGMVYDRMNMDSDVKFHFTRTVKNDFDEDEQP